MRRILAITLALSAAGCASAPVAPPPVAVAPLFEDKMAWILRLEDERILRDAVPPVPPPILPTATPARRSATSPVVTPTVTPTAPDLVRLLADAEARVRRRAALAIGRVGLAEGVAPLVTVLADPDPEVRQMAAYALGLLGDRRARDPLVAALADPVPIVQGSAAQALGLLGDRAAADALGQLALRIVRAGGARDLAGDQVDARRDVPAAVFRLALFALVRLQAYDQVAAAALDASGQPAVSGWPVAYALERLGDPRARPALMALAADPHPYTRRFAVRGLGELKDRAAVPLLLSMLAAGNESGLVIETLRALGRIGDPGAAASVLRLLRTNPSDVAVRAEAVRTLGRLGAHDASDLLLDLFGDRSPATRIAALQAVAALDPDQFTLVLSGLDPDPDWTVRAALASLLGGMASEAAAARLRVMLGDSDQRVVPAVLASLVRVRPPDLTDVLLAQLKADDPAVRAAAAAGLGETRAAKAAPALADAYQAGVRDASHVARVAALVALAACDAEAAKPLLRTALADKDWAVRVRADALLRQIDPARAADAATDMRPAPTTRAAAAYRDRRVVSPPFSTAVYLDTDRGTVQIELFVLDAPLTVEHFVALARKGFFDGLAIRRSAPDFVLETGDPRGDGTGGPGYTIRSETNEQFWLRGAVGIALEGRPDTGGSRFLVADIPQPQLDGTHTVFGRVVGGMDVVDQLRDNDVVRRVRVWDGATMSSASGN